MSITEHGRASLAFPFLLFRFSLIFRFQNINDAKKRHLKNVCLVLELNVVPDGAFRRVIIRPRPLNLDTIFLNF